MGAGQCGGSERLLWQFLGGGQGAGVSDYARARRMQGGFQHGCPEFELYEKETGRSISYGKQRAVYA